LAEVIVSADYSNVYWVGGGSGAGKLTIAQRIADVQWYLAYTNTAISSNSF